MKPEDMLNAALGGKSPPCAVCGNLISGEAMLELTDGMVMFFCRECSTKRDPSSVKMMDAAKKKAEIKRGMH